MGTLQELPAWCRPLPWYTAQYGLAHTHWTVRMIKGGLEKYEPKRGKHMAQIHSWAMTISQSCTQGKRQCVTWVVEMTLSLSTPQLLGIALGVYRGHRSGASRVSVSMHLWNRALLWGLLLGPTFKKLYYKLVQCISWIKRLYTQFSCTVLKWVYFECTVL